MINLEISRRISVEIDNDEIDEEVIIMLDKANQIGLSDGLPNLILDFSDEQLIENNEMDEHDVQWLQDNEQDIRNFLSSKGYFVIE